MIIVEMEEFYYEKNIEEKNIGKEILELLQEKYELKGLSRKMCKF